MEFLGILWGINAADSIGGVYVCTYGLAALGGFVSYYLAKNCKPSDSPSPSPASCEKAPGSQASDENNTEPAGEIAEQAQLQKPAVQPGEKPAPAGPQKAQDAVPFRLTVSNKYTAFGGIYAEGEIEEGRLRVGDAMYVYGKDGSLKFENARVVAINKDSGIKTDSVAKGESKYAAIRLGCFQYVGDVEYGDILSTAKIETPAPVQKVDTPPARKLPEPKTYNDPDRRKHITMATNDLACMCASGSLTNNREWVRNVGQDLYDAHGFEAMQEVFINVKTRYPGAQSQLSSIWDGVGGWAD